MSYDALLRRLLLHLGDFNLLSSRKVVTVFRKVGLPDKSFGHTELGRGGEI